VRGECRQFCLKLLHPGAGPPPCSISSAGPDPRRESAPASWEVAIGRSPPGQRSTSDAVTIRSPIRRALDGDETIHIDRAGGSRNGPQPRRPAPARPRVRCRGTTRPSVSEADNAWSANETGRSVVLWQPVRRGDARTDGESDGRLPQIFGDMRPMPWRARGHGHGNAGRSPNRREHQPIRCRPGFPVVHDYARVPGHDEFSAQPSGR